MIFNFFFNVVFRYETSRGINQPDLSCHLSFSNPIKSVILCMHTLHVGLNITVVCVAAEHVDAAAGGGFLLLPTEPGQ